MWGPNASIVNSGDGDVVMATIFVVLNKSSTFYKPVSPFNPNSPTGLSRDSDLERTLG